MRHPKPAVRAALDELTAEGEWILRKGGHSGFSTGINSCKWPNQRQRLTS